MGVFERPWDFTAIANHPPTATLASGLYRLYRVKQGATSGLVVAVIDLIDNSSVQDLESALNAGVVFRRQGKVLFAHNAGGTVVAPRSPAGDGSGGSENLGTPG